MQKVVIVGGVAAGASAAARLRRLSEKVEIVLFEKGEHISFANCGLPYYIGDVIQEREKLLVATPTLMKERFGIDVRVQSEVVSVDPVAKKVKVRTHDGQFYEEDFEGLVLAPGAKPIQPAIPGIVNEKILSLRNISDTDKIKEATKEAASIIVIGGGYIGVELAENLRHLEKKVTLIEAAPHILAPFDEDIVVSAERKLRENGVHLILNNGVKAFHEEAHQVKVELQDGSYELADFVVTAIGVTPDTSFLKDSGIHLGSRGHILTNEHMETNMKGIYAGGDAVEVIDFVTGQETAIPLAGPANKQGRIIADNLAGIPSTYKNTQGTSVIKVFDLTFAATGNNERQLDKLGIEHHAIILHPNNHAGYYPGATAITLKLIFDATGVILGAQAFGYEGVEKRIDVLATTLRLGGTVYDLTELELCYAPPFGSAKDPVNFAGYVAENILAGRSEEIHPRELYTLQDKPQVVVLDVRTTGERARGKVLHSVHINVNELRTRLSELDPQKEYWIYCAVGIRAYIAERILKQNGFKCKNITGGYKTLEALGFIEK
ncbi:CoA-disulfide reductase [Sporanaerobium hydrogeniformans]|uniref:CoA-disulfide reductase n=1 Tax=Sporanaerobium hydrogeniformans TaxID=3072179 RepID=A0AC61DCN3_9FIRM|nr:FAD-dependent oxidoreductase [Sporanaerobium hydrogeniformans]PHV70543.1 CoA-disulfide reductase [Sporanaerobium hydrogeniformans]